MFVFIFSIAGVSLILVIIQPKLNGEEKKYLNGTSS